MMDKAEFIRLRNSIAVKPVSDPLELLSSEDLKTRFFAEMALRDRTAT
jgi:hypothetical protein